MQEISCAPNCRWNHKGDRHLSVSGLSTRLERLRPLERRRPPFNPFENGCMLLPTVKQLSQLRMRLPRQLFEVVPSTIKPTTYQEISFKNATPRTVIHFDA